MKVSEPKMPALPGDGPYDPSDMHEYAKAYAAGIRAAVLAEVRAVVPGNKVGDQWDDERECGRIRGHNNCRAAILDALTTLEQQP